MGLRKAFNSSNQPNVQHRERKQKNRKVQLPIGMEVLGRKEANLDSNSDGEHTDDEFDLMTLVEKHVKLPNQNLHFHVYTSYNIFFNVC